MSSPELNFIYYSFATNSSWQICFIEKQIVHLRNFETNKVVEDKLSNFIDAVLKNQYREDKRQNEMFKFLNKINNVEPIPAYHERYKVSPKGSVGAKKPTTLF